MLPVKKILCPTDFSEPSLAALKAACELAAHFGAELCLLHVIPFTPPFPSDMIVVAAPNYYPSDAGREKEAQQKLSEIIQQHVPENVRTSSLVKMGYAAEEITSAAKSNHADLIVIGTHGQTGWRHLAFGSVAEKVVRLAQHPVLTMHSNPPQESVGDEDLVAEN